MIHHATQSHTPARRANEGSSCIVWQGAHSHGAPAVWANGKTQLLRRVIWQSGKGDIPEGMVVRMRCATQSCVNPECMELMTRGEMSRIGGIKGAIDKPESPAKRGQELPHSKLLDIDVISIRSAIRQRENLLTYIDENISTKALAKQYGVHTRTIERVKSYENYGHIA